MYMLILTLVECSVQSLTLRVIDRKTRCEYNYFYNFAKMSNKQCSMYAQWIKLLFPLNLCRHRLIFCGDYG